MDKRLIANRYNIVRTLSEGGMGKVYIAEDTLLANQIIALKTIKDEGNRQGFEQALLSEFYTLFCLSHPNILKVYDLGRDMKTNELFLITELVSGQSLNEYIKGCSFNDLIDIVYHILCGLGYLHKNNLIHGDIKPAHFIIDKKGPENLKIIDFGLVKQIQREYDGKIAGSIRYLAPEVFQGKGYSKQTDIYALGISLYTAIYDKYPFDASTVNKYISSAIYKTPVFEAPVMSVPESFIHVLKRALHPGLSMRYPDADTMLADICDKFHKKYHSTIANPSVFSPFINRVEEIGKLTENLYSLIKNKKRTPFICVFGDEGTGKERLLRQFKVHCKNKGLNFFSTKYIPAMEKHLSVLRMLIPYLYTYLSNAGMELRSFQGLSDAFMRPGTCNGPPLDIVDKKHINNDLIFSSIDLIVKSLEEGVPLVFIIEDYDLLDDYSKLFLRMLLEAIQRQGLGDKTMIILSSKFSIAMDGIKFENIEVTNFNKDISRHFISKILGEIPINDSFTERVYKASSGNALKTEKILQALLLKGLIYYREGIYIISNEAEGHVHEGQRDLNDHYIEIISHFTQEQRTIAGFLLYSYKAITAEEIKNMFEYFSLSAGMDFIFFLQQVNLLQKSIENGLWTLSLSDSPFNKILEQILTLDEKKKIHTLLFEYYSKINSEDKCLLCYHLYYSGVNNDLLASLIRVALEQVAKENVHSYKYLFFIKIAIELKDQIKDNKFIVRIIQKKINTLYFLNKKDSIEQIKYEFLTLECAKSNPLLYVSVLKSILDAYNLDFNNQKIEELLPYVNNVRSDDPDVINVIDTIRWNQVFLYLNQNKLDDALHLCSEIFKKIEHSNDNSVLSNYYGMIGELYNKKQDYKQSMYYKELSLNYANRSGIINQIAISEHNMAVGFVYINNWEEAIRYLKLAYEKFNKLRHYTLIGFTLNNLCEILINYKNDKQTALSYAVNALEINKIIGSANLITNYKILARIYKMLYKFDMSLAYLKKGRDLAISTNMLSSLLDLDILYIDILCGLSSYEDAIKVIRSSLKISRNYLNDYMSRIFLAKEGYILYQNNDITGFKEKVKELGKYTDINEAFIFLIYFYMQKDDAKLDEVYEYIERECSALDTVEGKYILFRSALYFYKKNSLKLKEAILNFFDFLQNDYNANWQDYYQLYLFSMEVRKGGFPEIKKKCHESHEFVKGSVPEKYHRNFDREFLEAFS